MALELRMSRVGGYLQREIGTLIHRELRDPRVGTVSVVGVEVSRDLAHARVHVTVLGCESAELAAPALAALNRASGWLRSRVAAAGGLRATPSLRFFYDRGVSSGRRVEALIGAEAEAEAEAEVASGRGAMS